MGVVKVSVTLDEETVREVKRMVGKGVSLSSIVDEGLRLQLHRIGMLKLLDEMDARNPISAAGQKAGEKLWAEIESSLTRARSRRSPRKKSQSE
jgi:Arc/MetJ-type ribon-helix-helix transcriptional regulator